MLSGRRERLAVLLVITGCSAATPPPPNCPPMQMAERTPCPTPEDKAPAAVPASGVLGVDHVGLTVTDLEASKALFIDVFGFRVRGEDKEYPAYFLTNDLTTITLWKVKDPDAVVPFNRKQNVGLHHLAFGAASFDALDALHLRLKDYPGVKIQFAPELAYGGPAKHMMFFEPSGNRIEIVHRPASP